MNFRLFALIVFVLPLVIGCQQNTENSEEPENQENQAEQQQTQAPQQEQPTPGARQSAMEVKEVSDQEFQRFMTAFQDMQTFRGQIQQDMLAAVAEEGLDAQRYSEIQRAQQNPAADSEVSSEEMQKFQSAVEKVQSIQSDANQQMQEKLSDAGFTQRRYQEVSMMVQSDPQLQQKFQSMQKAPK